MKEYFIGRLEDIPEGKGIAYKAGRTTIALFISADGVQAISNRCVHRGASMCDGELVDDGMIVRCPWHNWPFKLSTGEHVNDAREKIRTYRVHINNGVVSVFV